MNTPFEDIYIDIRTTNMPFEIRTHQGEEDEMISCFIPSADIYFSAKSWDDVDKKGRALMKSFISFWNEFNNNGQPKDFSHMKKDAA